MEAAQVSTEGLAILFKHWQAPKYIYNPTLQCIQIWKLDFTSVAHQWAYINLFIGQSLKARDYFQLSYDSSYLF